MLDPHDEQLLEAILTGLRRDDEPEVAARLAASPELAAELAELRSMQGDLDELGGEVADAVAAGDRTEVDDRAAELVSRTIGGLPLPSSNERGSELPRVEGRSSSGDGGRRSPWAPAVLLAAAVLLWLGLGLFGGSDEPPVDTMLGGDFTIEVLAPVEGGQLPAGFEWESVAGSGGSYRVTVYPLDAAQAVLEDTLTEPRWILTPDETRALPAEFRLEVHSLGVGGGVGPTGWLELRSSDH